MTTTTYTPPRKTDHETDYAHFPLDSIRMWRNARKTFDQEKLEELATSLLDSGEAHHAPVGFLVTDEPGTEIALFMGERRWRAYRLLRDRGHAEFATMLVKIRPRPTEAQLCKWSLGENLQREDLRPSEAGEELTRMLGMVDEGSGVSLWTMRSLADEIGKPVSYVSDAMLLVKAPDSVRSVVDEGGCALEVGALIGTLPEALREGAAAEMVHGPMGAMTREQARMWVGERYRRDLRKAVFTVDEVGLAGQPACTRCKWWGGGREDVAGRNAATVCLNPGCFLEKQRDAVLKRAAERGAQLTLWGEVEDAGIWEAHSGRLSPDSGYVEMGEKPSPQMLDSEVGEGVVMPSWGVILRDSGVVPQVAFDPMGQPRELVRTGEALRAAGQSSWCNLFREGAVAAYLSPEERAAERAVRAAGDKEATEVLLEGLAELRRGLEGSGDLTRMLRQSLRYVMGSMLKAEDLAVLATVVGAEGKSPAAIETATGIEADWEVALVLALLVRRLRYEGFAMMTEDAGTPLAEIASMAKFDPGAWHRRQKKRREAAQLETRALEEKKIEDAAKKAMVDAGRARRSA